MGARGKLLLLSWIGVALALVYVFQGIEWHWDYVMARRVLKVAAAALTAVVVACSTVIFQTITTNRILTPSVIGIDSLYILMQTAVVFVLGATSAVWTNVAVHFTLSAGLLIAFSVLLYRGFFRREAFNLYLILLIGLVFGIFFQSVASFLQMLIDPNEFLILQGRMFADFNAVDIRRFTIALVTAVLVTVYFIPSLRYLDVLALGRDHALNLGVDYDGTVRRLWIVITAFVAVATSLAGPVTFLGLLVANVAYEFFKTHRHKILLPGSSLISIVALLGALLIVERVFTFTTTVSVIVNLIGGVYFLRLVLKESQP